MSRPSLRSYFMPVILMVAAVAMMATTATAAPADDARQFVDNVGKQVLGVVNAGGDKGQKQAQLQKMFTDNVDMDWMAQFVLGRSWQQATEDQRTRYTQAYRQYLLTRYTTNFSDYTGSNYTITDVKSDEDGQFTVNMQIKTPKGGNEPDTAAGYRVRNNGGQYKIVDIIIEGVSLITTERSEFSSVVQQKGMDGLISSIQAKTKG